MCQKGYEEGTSDLNTIMLQVSQPLVQGKQAGISESGYGCISRVFAVFRSQETVTHL